MRADLMRALVTRGSASTRARAHSASRAPAHAGAPRSERPDSEAYDPFLLVTPPDRRGGRYPLTAEEIPHALALGRRLRAAQADARLSRRELATRALLTPKGLGLLERGQRRTRRSTLARLASALTSPQRAPALLAELEALAGPVLVLEAPNAAELERDRAQRFRRKGKEETRELATLLRTLADGTLSRSEAAHLPWLLATSLRSASTERAAARVAARVLREIRPAARCARLRRWGREGAESE